MPFHNFKFFFIEMEHLGVMYFLKRINWDQKASNADRRYSCIPVLHVSYIDLLNYIAFAGQTKDLTSAGNNLLRSPLKINFGLYKSLTAWKCDIGAVTLWHAKQCNDNLKNTKLTLFLMNLG